MKAENKCDLRSTRWSVKRRLVSALLVLSLLAACYGYSSLVLQRFITISAGEVYQTGPGAPNDLLGMAKDYGIRTVIDLRDITEVPGVIARDRLAFRDSGIDFIHLPAKDLPGDETILSFLSIVADPENRPVLIQSQYASGRAAIFASLYRVEFENWDNESARRAVESLFSRGVFQPDAPQGEFLLSYKPHGIRLARNAGD